MPELENLNKKYPGPELIRPEADAGDYYANKDRQARYYSKALDEARAAGAPRRELEFLRLRLTAAYHTGD